MLDLMWHLKDVIYSLACRPQAQSDDNYAEDDFKIPKHFPLLCGEPVFGEFRQMRLRQKIIDSLSVQISHAKHLIDTAASLT
jgi:hypothetical protein